MTPEQKQRIEQIEKWQESRRGLVDSARKHADLDASHPEIRMHGYIDFLLSLVKSQEGTHGFAPMDNLSDVCGALTSDGYCWRPLKHPIHGASTGMSLYECNTPAQAFNSEREKKVAKRAATSMRSACVEKARERARAHRRIASAINYGEVVDVPVPAEQQCKLADELDAVAKELESVSIQEQK